MSRAEARARDLVLVGGGHTHVQVLASLAMSPLAGVRTTVVLDVPVAVYSGMVPGFVAGQYRADELEIDVVPLARRAGARVILSPAVGIDPVERRLALEGRAPLRYDAVSFDIGSTVAGADLPGVREHALSTRPIGRFVDRFEDALTRVRERRGEEPIRLVVVGGGAGGIEVAFALRQRLEREVGQGAVVTVLQNRERILPGAARSLVRRVERRAVAAGVVIRCEREVESVEPDAVVLRGGERVAADLVVWVTGAAARPIFSEGGLPVDERGFVKVRPTLQVEGFDDIFAAGDCASLVRHPATPKAGVYAVRQGPFLSDNLRAWSEGGEMRSYRPQSDFLALLNLGDGTAIGGKWGFSFEGRWVMRLKDRIDRRFMRRFQVLRPDGSPAPEHPPMDGEMEMICGGCAAKVGQGALNRALARVGVVGAVAPEVVLGLDRADDAAAVRTPRGDLVALSVDLFSAFTDDPFVVGRAAAVNAVSDVLCTGGRPRHAMAIVAVPESADEDEAEEVLVQVLEGARRALEQLGVVLVGGHTTTAAGLMVGFSVDGELGGEERLLRLDGLEVGQRLMLSEALGTGVIFRADMLGVCRGSWLQEALAAVVRDNREAAELAVAAGATAVTDVTGFGLAGHLGSMLRASEVSARVRMAGLPLLPGARELLAQGHRSTFHAENERALRAVRVSSEAARDPAWPVLFDPQTAGGLLFGVDEEQARTLPSRLSNGAPLRVIGEVVARSEEEMLFELV